MRASVLLLALVVVGCQSQPPSAATEKPAIPEGMVLIPAGGFTMGSDDGFPDERPQHIVELDAFYMDTTEVTNRQFEAFVKATGYVTEAEKVPNIPGVPKEKLVPGGLVFTEGKHWAYTPGANWRHPEGPDTSIEKRMDHPVVQVSWDDANAYAQWAGKRLPTEAEFEYAARGGLKDKKYSWGDTEPDPNHPQANIWQGQFPVKNDNTDGFVRTAPVKSFAPNGYGLYDIAGNVWEWCADWYRPDAYAASTSWNPTGPKDSVDPDEPGAQKRVVRGGSYLCAECSCRGYRVTARMKTTHDTGLCHTGFRCVKPLAPTR